MKAKEILFEYFTQQEANLFAFYRIPKELFTHPKYKHVCADAKILYGLLLDQYSRKEAMEVLEVGEEKVDELFKELREVDLIEEAGQEVENR